MTIPTPSDRLLKARRAIDGAPGVTLLEDLRWFADVGKFGIRFQIDREVDAPHIPRRTEWFAVLDASYPYGSVLVVPSKTNGLRVTFPHQSHNSSGESNLPWRNGDVCVAVYSDSVRLAGSAEPRSNGRLLWRVLRLLEWLDRASTGTLATGGDPFELPQYPVHNPRVMGYAEDQESYTQWQALGQSTGLVKIGRVGNALITKRFEDVRGRELFRPEWGQAARMSDEAEIGGWILLREPLHCLPWHGPGTWFELREALGDLWPVFLQTIELLRSNERPLVLFGMPMPKMIGQPPIQIHWQALRVPEHSLPDHLNGFRPTARNRKLANELRVFHDEGNIEWIRSENWSREQLSRRRVDGFALSKARILLIGCGSIGSCVAELLVRSGVGQLILCDGDIVSGGVLIRSHFGMDQVGLNKATALKNNLIKAVPHANLRSLNQGFTPSFDESRFGNIDLIINCTANWDTFNSLSTARLNPDTPVATVFVGSRAEVLYFQFGPIGQLDSLTTVNDLQSLMESSESGPPDPIESEGVGCYHPAFPADVHRVWLHACQAMELIAQRMNLAETPFMISRPIWSGGTND